MKILALLAFASLLPAQPTPAVDPAPPSAPKPVTPAKSTPPAVSPSKQEVVPSAAKPSAPKGESLKYELNWASGLSLGEAILTAAPSATQLNFAFQMDASVPGFLLSESADSRATPEFCSVLLYKRGSRGKRKVDERTEFDPDKMTATRKTEGGGKSELSTSRCAKDALTYFYFMRRELAAGRLPTQQRVYYGGPYSVTVKFAGSEKVRIGGESVDAEKISASIKGANADITADLFFARDAVRTPLLVQVPLKVGALRLELVR